MQLQIIRAWCIRLTTLTLSLLLVLSFCIPAGIANAEPTTGEESDTSSGTTATEIYDEPDEFQRKVEQTARDYDEAQANLEKLVLEIEDNNDQIEVLEAELPAQQAKTDEAMKALYFMQQEGYSLIDMILSAATLDDFLTSVEYVDRIQQSNLNEINRLTTLRENLNNTQATLDEKKTAAESEAIRSEDALKEAKAARAEAQAKAKAKAEAEAAAAAEALAKAEAQAKADAEAKAKEVASAKATTPTAEPKSTKNNQSSESEPKETSSSGNDVDWSSDKKDFVNKWTSRINDYLSGSKLSGQGKAFAEAAWNYGVDPRWSPAISCTESTKGAACFKPHNAWGWGSVSWSSWEEAIDAHVRGLANGYGYTISVSSAKKYCPSNWEHWYSFTLSEMNKI